jgi:hypothetical protein
LKRRLLFSIGLAFFAVRLGYMAAVMPAPSKLFVFVINLALASGIGVAAWLRWINPPMGILLVCILVAEMAGKFFQAPVAFGIGSVISLLGIGYALLVHSPHLPPDQF